MLGQGAQLPEEPLLEVLLLEGPQQEEQEARQVVRQRAVRQRAGQEAPGERPREPEVPPPREEPRARVPAARLLGQVQGQVQERELLRREPELRVLLRRYRHRLEPAQRPPQRCRLRRPKFLQ